MEHFGQLLILPMMSRMLVIEIKLLAELVEELDLGSARELRTMLRETETLRLRGGEAESIVLWNSLSLFTSSDSGEGKNNKNSEDKNSDNNINRLRTHLRYFTNT